MSINIEAIFRILQTPNGTAIIEKLANAGLIGSSGNDTLTGTSGNNLLSGGTGADLLDGGDGNDVLSGGADDDMLAGGAGSDILLGGTGNDTLDGGEGTDQLWGNEGNDVYWIDSSDVITEYENQGEDSVIIDTAVSYYALDVNFENLFNRTDAAFHGVGNVLNNKLFGGSNNDYLEGLDGNDTLMGLAGDDVLSGGNGNDFLNGGIGLDTLTGGNGDDTYAISDTLDDIVELENGGTDSVRTSLNYYELSNQVENLLFAVDGGYFEGHGNALNNTIESNADISLLFGHGGQDTLLGGIGDDYLSGGEGADQIYGGIGSDTLVYLDHSVSVDVDLGRGTSESSFGSDTFSSMENIIGGSGNDVLTGDAGVNYIYGSAGDDLISGEGGDDYLSGDTGDDKLHGGDGDDHLDGGEGNDVLFDDAGNDELQGGVGTDTASFIHATSSITVDIESESASSADGIDKLLNIENIRGSNHDDFITGNSLNNELSGNAGNDMLDGSWGNDTLIGNSGNDLFLDWLGFNSIIGGDDEDTISYANLSQNSLIDLRAPTITIDLGANLSSLKGFSLIDFPGAPPSSQFIYSQNFIFFIENAVGSYLDDVIYGNSENNKIYGLSGNDRVSGGLGDDTINGEDGIDTLIFNYLKQNKRTTVSLIENSSSVFNDLGIKIETDEIFNIENVIGSYGNDEIIGNDEDNHLDGGSGSDALYGLGGNDTLIGGSGSNYIDGGEDSDTVDYRSASAGLVGSLETQYLTSGSDADTLVSIENIIASVFDDELFGDNQDNRIDGRSGRDILTGLAGKDILIGGDDNDQLFGDAEDDQLIGGNGNDQLFGGTGDDWLNGGEGNDRLFGGADDDWLVDTEGADSFFGGDGIDYADFSTATTSIFASLSQKLAKNIADNNEAVIFYSNLDSIENLQGSRFNDMLDGDYTHNVINGGLGEDTVSYNYLLAGHSVDANLLTGQVLVTDSDSLIVDTDTLAFIENLTGSSGNDTLIGNDKDNVLIGGGGADRLSGGAGNDVIYAEIKKDLLIDGGDDIDTLHIVFSSSSTELLSNFFFMDGLSGFTNFENLVGSHASEYLRGDVKNNLIDGGLGNDEIYGRGGNDILKGGDGINNIIGGTGHNIIDGTSSLNSNSTSVASYEISESLIIDLRLEKGNARLASSETASFTLIDDYINISAVWSGIGNDLITGNSQNNILNGNFGDDQIFSMGGDDFLDGGLGSDILEGGTGSDVFVFKTYRLPSSDSREDIDTILDFGFGGNDKIDLRSFGALDANTLKINQTQAGSTVIVEGINFTQKIIVEGPLANSLNMDNFILSGYSGAQTDFFDNVSNYFL